MGTFVVSVVYVSLERGARAVAAEPVTLPEIEVHATTPLAGVPLAREKLPANVQAAGGESYRERGALNVADFLARALGGVSLAHVQNNPFQPDLLYRGFTGSFLIGTPPGLSVFVDGVRINEPLADQVNWDLIAADAIERVELVPGSNPIYGRNTLGGAVVISTKRGATSPGTVAEAWGGSFGRLRSLVQTGGIAGPADYFLSASWLTEEGFRDFSRTDVGQMFAKVGAAGADTDATVSLTYVNNLLTGNGPLPESRLRRDRSAVFTHPDRFSPELWQVVGEVHHDVTPGVSVIANVYGRFLNVGQFNRDVAEDVDARTEQDGWGSTVQLTMQGSVAAVPVTAVAGVDYSGAVIDHVIAELEAAGGDDDDFVARAARISDVSRIGHAAAATGFASGFEIQTDVHSETHAAGAFATATVEPHERLAITAAARFDATRLRIDDRLSGPQDDTDASGSHSFEQLNPAIGATFRAARRLTLYGSYARSYRAPTAIELTCANPEAPCPIPTAIVDDPPLDPVKGRTWEAGVRWTLERRLDVALALFRTDLEDDILFRNEPQSRVLGFFQNVDGTRRQGFELLTHGAWRNARWFANYTLTEATFETDVELFTFANEDRVAKVEEGDSLSLVPKHRVNGGFDVGFASGWSFGMDAAWVGSQVLRGDEANERRRLDAYFVANARVAYEHRGIETFLRFENVFDSDYETYGAFFENTLDGTGVERFLGPAAPFGVFGGVRVEL